MKLAIQRKDFHQKQVLNKQWKEYFLSENRQNVGGFLTWVPGEKSDNFSAKGTSFFNPRCLSHFGPNSVGTEPLSPTVFDIFGPQNVNERND